MLATPYPIRQAIAYESGKFLFTSNSGNEYEILFARIKNDYAKVIISFNLLDSDDGYEVTNDGEIYRVIATVANAVNRFMLNNSYITTFEFSGEHKLDEEPDCVSQRTKIFLRYVPYVFNLREWGVKTISNSVIIFKSGE